MADIHTLADIAWQARVDHRRAGGGTPGTMPLADQAQHYRDEEEAVIRAVLAALVAGCDTDGLRQALGAVLLFSPPHLLDNHTAAEVREVLDAGVQAVAAHLRAQHALALEQVTRERDRLRERMANVAERLRGLVLGFDRNVAPSWMGSIDHWGADMQSATTETLDYAADLIYAAQKDGGERG